MSGKLLCVLQHQKVLGQKIAKHIYKQAVETGQNRSECVDIVSMLEEIP
jgi:hypothetical protein